MSEEEKKATDKKLTNMFVQLFNLPEGEFEFTTSDETYQELNHNRKTALSTKEDKIKKQIDFLKDLLMQGFGVATKEGVNYHYLISDEDYRMQLQDNIMILVRQYLQANETRNKTSK